MNGVKVVSAHILLLLLLFVVVCTNFLPLVVMPLIFGLDGCMAVYISKLATVVGGPFVLACATRHPTFECLRRGTLYTVPAYEARHVWCGYILLLLLAVYFSLFISSPSKNVSHSSSSSSSSSHSATDSSLTATNS